MLTAEILLEHTSDAVVDLDEGLRIRVANDRAALLYRRPVPDLVGNSLLALFPDLRGTAAQERLTAARASRIPIRFELFIPSLFAWHSVLAVPRPGFLTLFVRDVTDRVRRENDEAVQAAVRGMIENMPLCVTVTRGPKHRVEMANALARSLVGSRAVEGELVETLVPEAREQGFIDLLDRVYATREPFRGEEVPLTWRPTPETPVRTGYFDLVYVPMFDVAGSVSGILHLAIDVTEKVARRGAVERLAGERAAILEQLSEGVVVTDGSGTISFVNDAAERMHGVKLLGVPPDGYARAYSLLTDDGEPHPVETLPLTRAVRHAETVVGAIWKIRRPDGSVLRVVGNAKPVLSTDGQVLACVLTLMPAMVEVARQS